MGVRQAKLVRQQQDLYDGKGCEVNPVLLGCLSCPLEVCRYDDPAGYQLAKRRERDLVMVDLMTEKGLTAAETGRRFSVTVRTVFRVLLRVRKWLPDHVVGLELGRHDGEQCGCAAVLAVPALRRGRE